MHARTSLALFVRTTLVAVALRCVTMPTLCQFCVGVVMTGLVGGLAAITVPLEQ